MGVGQWVVFGMLGRGGREAGSVKAWACSGLEGRLRARCWTFLEVRKCKLWRTGRLLPSSFNFGRGWRCGWVPWLRMISHK